MIDPRLLRLLRDCDTYLVAQRTLLVQASQLDCPPSSVAAMSAALDQLARSVSITQDAIVALDTWEPQRRNEASPSRLRRGDPGE